MQRTEAAGKRDLLLRRKPLVAEEGDFVVEERAGNLGERVVRAMREAAPGVASCPGPGEALTLRPTS